MTASLVIATIALIFTFISCISIAVLVSRALDRAFSELSAMHKRNSEHVSDLLDRLMTVRWEDLVTMRSMEEVEEGGFEAPAEGEELGEVTPGLYRPGMWGSLQPPREADTSEEELQEMLEEDFPREREVNG